MGHPLRRLFGETQVAAFGGTHRATGAGFLGPLFLQFKCPVNLLPGESVNGNVNSASFHQILVVEFI